MRRVPARPAYKPVTDSPAFRGWFRASKVVDEQGEPLVVFHGTTSAMESGMFDPAYANINARTDVPDAFFFSSSPPVAATYASEVGGRRYREGANVVPVYLRLEKPLVVDLRKWESAPYWNEIPYRAKWWTLNDLARHAMRRGYDGLIIRNVRDVYDYDALRGASSIGDTYVAFSPYQVKSATGNVGAFDLNDPRIVANPSRRRNGVSEPHRAEKPDAVVMDPKRMARVFIENPKVRRNPSRRNPASETYLEGVERREKRKGKTERAVGKAQLAHGGAVLGMAVAKKAAPAVAVRLGATVGARAIPIVGEVLMAVGAGKEAYKVGKRRLKGGGGSWKTDLAKVGAGAVGLEDFVPEAEENGKQAGRKAVTKAKKNPRSSRPQVYFDMDETLLHSVEGGRAGLPRIKVGPFYYGVSVRPDAADALREAAQHADVYVLTTADRQYALKALDAAGLLGPGSPIRKVYSTREAADVPPPAKRWVLLDNDPLSAMEKTSVLVGYDAPERVTLVPDYLAQPRAGRTALLTGLKKALRRLEKD
jgi:hypothetical protein